MENEGGKMDTSRLKSLWVKSFWFRLLVIWLALMLVIIATTWRYFGTRTGDPPDLLYFTVVLPGVLTAVFLQAAFSVDFGQINLFLAFLISMGVGNFPWALVLTLATDAEKRRRIFGLVLLGIAVIIVILALT